MDKERRIPLISIVICTHNRVDLVHNAIASLLEQDILPGKSEFIIVDNASTDHTHEVVEKFMVDHPNIQYVYEPIIGLSFARNHGWQVARSDYVAYLDDDSLVSPHWLMKALEIIANQSPLAFGGPFYPFYITPKPAWYKDEYGSYVKAKQACFTDDESFITGGNMCIRREVLEKEHGFPEELGMKGNKFSYGEETFLFRRLVTQYGKCLYFDPEFFIYHLVRPEKMHFLTLMQMRFASGRDYHYAILANGGNKNGILWRGKSCPSFLSKLKHSRNYFPPGSSRNGRKSVYLQQYLYEMIFRVSFYVGVGYSSIRISLKRIMKT
jgi:glycosyltransferase involved in cell wall biosynthesis